MLPEGKIGLDSLSTIDFFSDFRMLTNIRKAVRPMEVTCNDGNKEVKFIDHLAGYGEVWFDPTAFANILSIGRVSKQFKVTFDSEGVDGFVLHLPEGRKRSFKQTDQGLYETQFLRRRKGIQEVTLTISTVEGNNAHFTKREVRQEERI